LTITAFMIVIGLGMGGSFSLLNIATLNAVPPQYKGSTSSLITFFRTIGSALGVTVFGALQKHDFQEGIRQLPNMSAEAAERIKGGQALLDPAIQAQMGLSAEAVNALLGKLADSILYVFQWSALLPVLALIFVWLLGRSRMEKPAPGTRGAPGKPGGSGDSGPPQGTHRADKAAKPEPTFHGS